MNYQQLLILLPCHGLEDFPIHHDGEEAEGLLAAWTSLFHPVLLASSQRMPQWYRVDDPPEELAERLILIPAVSLHELQTGFPQRAKEEGATVVRRKTTRDEYIEAALKPLTEPAAVNSDWVNDFFALGYCYLQVQLLTRQMRYSSNLDEVHFQNQIVAAANAAVSGDQETMQTKLQACFDLLAEERDHYYPVEAYLLDLTMLAPTTLGSDLRSELKQQTPVNLLMNGELLAELAEKHPETLTAIQQTQSEGRVGIVGGDDHEQRYPLLALESLRSNILAGRQRFAETLDMDLKVYGRRRFGLAPALPQILVKTGFVGAVHTSLDDGQFPAGTQATIRWEGSDGTSIDAMSKTPANANLPETFLGLAVKMGESMDSDHVAVVCLAHWPGQSSCWYRDLQRAAKYGNALGRFVTLDEFFDGTDMPGYMDKFSADQYRSPYLKQAVIRRHPDPLSSSVRYWKRRVATDLSANLTFLRDMISGRLGDDGTDAGLFCDIDRASEAEGDPALDERIAEAIHRSALQLGHGLPRADGDLTDGCLVFNPHSFIRRFPVDISGLPSPPSVGGDVYACNQQQAIVDVPAMGYTWLPAGGGNGQSQDPAMAEDGILRNEFMQVIVHEKTGSIQSVHEYETRGNRLSQRLAFRWPSDRNAKPGDVWQDPDQSANYTEMVARSIEITQSTSILGEIVSRGDLVDGSGNVLAGFEQTLRLERGSRVLLVDIELTPKVEPKSDPWNSYFACRFVWGDQSAELYRAVNQSRELARAKRIESPQYLEIASGDARTTLFSGGLPYHRRTGLATLDTLLVVRGESARKFRLGIGIDVKNSQHEALALLSPPTSILQTGVHAPSHASSWLFHIDARNVIATTWSPILENEVIVGYRVRLLETGGRIGRGKIRSFRAAKSAQQVDFCGQSLSTCEINDGAVVFEMAANQWIELEVRT